jgi:hypothetical protein
MVKVPRGELSFSQREWGFLNTSLDYSSTRTDYCIIFKAKKQTFKNAAVNR